MILPVDNSIDLAQDNEHVCLDEGEIVAPTIDSVRQLLPGYVRDAEGPTVDAILNMTRTTANLTQAQVGQQLAAQKSPRFAFGSFLDEWGVLMKRPRSIAEEEGSYRDRLLVPMKMVSPNAIKEAVRALVAQFSAIHPVFIEPTVDGAYAATDTADVWSSFAQPDDRILWSFDTTRPEKIGGIYAMPEAGPEFWILIPFTGENDQNAFAQDDTAANATASDFVANDTVEWGFATLDSAALSDLALSEVEARRGGGTIWKLFIEPLLSTAV